MRMRLMMVDVLPTKRLSFWCDTSTDDRSISQLMCSTSDCKPSKQGRFQAQGHGCLPALLRFCHKFLWCCDAGVRGTVKDSTIKIQGCSEWTELPKGKRFLACELPYETSRDRWKHGTGLDLACAIHTLTTVSSTITGSRYCFSRRSA